MRAFWLASAALLTACYPEFHFGDTGAGGDGATATTGRGSGPSTTSATTSGSGGAGTTTTTDTVTTGSGGGANTTTTSTGVMEKIVSCGPPVSGTLHACGDGQVCCYDTSDPAGDKCDAPGGCGGNAYELACDEASDCPTGMICCAQFFSVVGIPYFDGSIGCAASCSDPDRPMCKSNADCDSGKTCEPLEDLDPDYGNDYRACW